jgi:hypothetical protein
MNHKIIARGCPWRVMARNEWMCKALIGQPNCCQCHESNCAGLHIADLLLNEILAKLGGTNEDSASTKSASGRNEG